MEDPNEERADQNLYLARLAVASMERSRHLLSRDEEQDLSLLMEQMAARYPHQDMATAIGGYYRDYMLLAERHGLEIVRTALQELRIMPSQRFFPQPSECAAVMEAIVKRRKEKARSPYRPCGIADCSKLARGMRLITRDDGSTAFAYCECYFAWKRSANAPVVDFKSAAAGEVA